MTKWQRKIDISNEWNKRQNNEITLEQLSKTIANKLKKLKPFNDGDIDFQKDELVDYFNDFKDHEGVEEFDNLMSMLYDWGDISLGGPDFFNIKKVCWVNTI